MEISFEVVFLDPKNSETIFDVIEDIESLERAIIIKREQIEMEAEEYPEPEERAIIRIRKVIKELIPE